MILKRLIPALKQEMEPHRYPVFIRAQLFVLTGYVIVMSETLIGIALNIVPVSYTDIFIITGSVLSTSICLLGITLLINKLKVWHEWLIFGMYLVIYLFFYTIWVYKLQHMRILGLMSILIAVTIVISYTTIVQSLIMSLLSLFCVFGSIYYSVFIKKQADAVHNDLFMAFCLFPAIVLISIAAYYINRRRLEIINAKHDLEELNLHLYDVNSILQEEQRISRIEMDLARDIQSHFFPSSAPDTENWDVAFRSVPSSGVSGDFYDFYYSENKLKGISLFDVSGHGVAPALVTILAKPVFYRNFNSSAAADFSRVFEESNRDLYDQLEHVHIFITGVMLKLEADRIEYINAGHPDIMLKKKSGGGVDAVTDDGGGFKGHPVGISMETRGGKSMVFRVESGDMLLLYSDGVVDCRNPGGEYFTVNRLMDSFSTARGESAAEVLDCIMGDFQKFISDSSLTDDITIIVARKK